jgi:predicted dehydrogenase
MSEKLSWGIIGAGHIAGVFARGIAHSRTGKLVAVGSRSQDKADTFGEEFDVPKRHGSYEELLADPDIEAVYVATPHPMHAAWSIKAAEAGKHILCEKPLAMNHAEAAAMVEAARRNNVFLMEAFMYRCHPQTAKIVELLRNGAIGEVRVIHATFSFGGRRNLTGRLYAKELGGGGILDVGCYTASMARLIAGAAMGRDFADPILVSGAGYLGETGVDEWAVASLKFEGGILANLACGVDVPQHNDVKIFGSEGQIIVPWPWSPAKEGGKCTILVGKHGDEELNEIVVETRQWLYAFEADMVAANRDRLEATPPAMTWADSLGNMQTLDRWREAIGLAYDADDAAAR